MKVYISADIEGITGVTDWAEARKVGGIDYDKACLQMTREVAAACRGAIAAGAEEVLVKDGHGTGLNIDGAGLPRGVKLFRSWGKSEDSMMVCVDRGFDMAFMVGYHSEAYDDGNPLSHTSNSSKIYKVTINGERAAEMNINAMIAARYGVPVALVTGDKGICEKALKDLPGVRVAAVKEGIGSGTLNFHPDDACDLIENEAYEAVKNFKKSKVKCVKIPKKIVMELQFKDHTLAKGASLYPGTDRVDEMTVRYTCNSIEDMLKAYQFMF